MDSNVNQSFGGLVEGVHLAGYSLERAFRKLEWLLDEDRWKSVGGGYEDINAFLDTIKLDSFKIIASERKKIAERIKKLQPEASNRQIAKVVGASHTQVARDLGTDVPADGTKASKNNRAKKGDGTNVPSPLSGAAAAKAVESKETKEERKAAKQEARSQREAALGAKQIALPDKQYGVILADPEWKFETWSELGLDNSSPDNHYPTSELDAIKARDVASIAADDCVLFLWAPSR